MKLTNNLLALGSAAVVTVYAAGYHRTRAAAQRFAEEAVERHPPAQPSAGAVAAGATEPQSLAVPPRSSASSGGVALSSPATKSPRPSGASPNAVTAGQATTRDSAAAAPADSAAWGAVPAPPVSAPASPPASPPPAADTVPVAGVVRTPDPAPQHTNQPPALKDGMYTGWGTSRHGDIQAAVVIQDGRIVSASIAQCLTRYSCSWIAALPPQVVSRQSPDVDYVSGATQSTNAFYYAVVEALAKAK